MQEQNNMSAQPVDVLADLAAAHEARAEYFRSKVKPSARKSYGAYKPVLVHADGRTEVCGQRAETRYREWHDGRPNPRTAYVSHKRGTTFDSREAAIAYAADCIAVAASDAAAAADKARERALARVQGGAA